MNNPTIQVNNSQLVKTLAQFPPDLTYCGWQTYTPGKEKRYGTHNQYSC